MSELLKREQVFSVSLYEKPEVNPAKKRKPDFIKRTRKDKFGKTDSAKLVSGANQLSTAVQYKKQNRFSLEEQIIKIDGKLIQLAQKLEKAKRNGADTTVLESLFLKCSYRRHVVSNMVLERENKRQEQIAEHTGKIKMASGEFFPVAKVYQPAEKPMIPVSLGRQYKVKRRIVKDHIGGNGTVSRKANHTGSTSISERKALGMREVKPRKPHIVRYVSKPADLLAQRLTHWRNVAGFDATGFLVL